uniref:Uncharacterized protein n=1 Tax=viral metagenome TaxID=1070528 RepID=A0A6H1ZH69_9ZZZZ
MARNTDAMKRGWNWDAANGVLCLMVDGVEVMKMSTTAATNNKTLTQTGVATFITQDVHSAGLTVASTKPVIQGTLTLPKMTLVTKTSGAGYTMTATEVLSGIVSDATATGAIAVTLPTVAAIVALLPGYVAGTSFKLIYKNTGTQTATLTTDASAQWTMVGTMTIITTKQSEFLFIVASGTTGSVYCTSSNVGY